MTHILAAQSISTFVDWALDQGRIWLISVIGLAILATLVGMILTKAARGAIITTVVLLLFVAWVALNWRSIIDAGQKDFNDHSNASAVIVPFRPARLYGTAILVPEPSSIAESRTA